MHKEYSIEIPQDETSFFNEDEIFVSFCCHVEEEHISALENTVL